MNYTRFQKNLSSFLIFAILILQTVEIPVFQMSRANASDHRDLVSLIVDESMYSGDMKSKILRYAEDIQAHRANTRAVIFPVPKTVNPFGVASINEKLYYEGDGVSLSRLVGTVLIGDLPLPVVHRGGKAFLSVYPYTDFENKSFVYDTTKGYYDYANRSSTDEKPEVWHSVIQPNTGNAETDRAKLLAFLDKTHDYYAKQGNFSSANTLSEPRVFYFDGLHDEKTSTPAGWKLYNLGLQYMEDLAYNRYNKYLAKSLYDASQKLFRVDTSTITDASIKKLLADNAVAPMDLSKNPDITTRDVILKATKQFFEVFNKAYMGDILRFVHNAGRYGDDSNVRVDSVPVMIAKKDMFTRQALRDANTVVEGVIDSVVSGGLARDLPMSTSYDIATTTYEASGEYNGVADKNGLVPKTSHTAYANYFFGRKAETVTRPLQCTIVRGSTLTAELNRGYNLANMESDTSALTSGGGGCFSGTNPLLSSFWGGNSPLGLDVTNMRAGDMTLKSHRYTGFSRSAYDLAGARELSSDSPLHIARPEDCLARDFLLQQGFSCNTVHQSASLQNFDTYYRTLPSERCTTQSLSLDGKQIKSSGSHCEPDIDVVNYAKSYGFKRISSVTEHKSPTDEEYGAALTSMTTPSLASDRDRYVDFISARGKYAKIVYPNLFRITLEPSEMTYEWARARIKSLFDAKSDEINTLITSEKADGLSGADREIANLLASGTYPSARVDLYAKLAQNEKALATAVESVLWKNLDNATLKYAFILEHSLDIDGNAKISLDDKKNDYEIATLGSAGDARNMYVKIDPETRGLINTGVTNILSQVSQYRSLVSSTNLTSLDEDPKFECGPPEWVPIWQWLPAVFCWLGTILPPKISAGSCTTSSLPLRDDNAWSDKKYQLDANGNGIIDGNEVIADGQLQLTSDGEQYSYGANIPLQATLLKNGKIISIDSFNRVTFELVSLTSYTNATSGTGKKLVYERGAPSDGLGNIANITPYITFKSMQVPSQNGVAKYLFTAKNTDVDAVFEARIRTYDLNGKLVVDRTSNRLSIDIRSERIAVRSQVQGANGYEAVTAIEAGQGESVRFSLERVSENGAIGIPSLPYTLRVTDDITGTDVLPATNIPRNEYVFSDKSILNKAGIYRFAFTDKRGVTGYTTLNVLPAPPVKLEAIPSSNTFVKGEKTTVLVRLLDTFGNLANSHVYTLRGSISGGGYFTDKDRKNLGASLEKGVVDGYTSFDLTADASGDQTLKFRIDRINLESSILRVKAVDYAKVSVDVADRESITVGGEKRRIKLSILGRDGKRITGFNGVAALSFPKLSGTLSSSFVKIVDGVSVDDVYLTPQSVAGKDLLLDVQIPGISLTEWGNITVLPGVPMIVDYANPNPRMEARESSTTTIRATLYDRYGNIASNASGHSLTLSIPEEYAKFAKLKSATTLPFQNGALTFDVAATARPGKAYVIGRVSPDLSKNTFSVTDAASKTITVRGVSENVSLIDTYYLFNEEKLDRLRYDALYTTLMGGEYGDVTKFGYLWGAILFDDASKSLAVTSLINAPWKRDQLFGLTPAGKYSYSEPKDSIAGFTAELSSDSDRTFISFYDRYSRDYIARAWLRFDPDATDLFACVGSGTTQGISDCQISDRTSVVMKWFDGAQSTKDGDSIVLKNPEGSILVRIGKNGSIEKYPSVSLELDPSQTANMLGVRIVSGRATIGYLGIKFASSSIEAYPSSAFPNILLSRKNAIVMEAISSRYAYDKTYLGNSSRGSQGIVFYAKDSYMNLAATDTTYAGRQDVAGLEQYPKQTGIGWEGTNRSMLELAGGASVGEANKFFATYSTITLGDAVATLPRLSNTASNFDRTIGRQVSSGAWEQIESYEEIDFNGDKVLDVVIFYTSGKIQLLANYDGSLKDMGYLAYVSDAGEGRKGVGDFFRDGYDDIALVDKKGKLIVLDNIEGKFSRIDPVILSESGATVSLSGAIRQLEVFDMDRDGATDIVTVDDAGELNVLYGTNRAWGGTIQHVFTKKLVDNGLGLSISPNARMDGGAFTYDGLPQITGTGIIDTDTGSLSTAKTILDNMIYYQDSYSIDRILNSPSVRNAILRASVGTPADGSPSATDTVDAINAGMAQIEASAGSGRVDFSAFTSSSREARRTYIRSQYAEAKGLSVEKRYADTNGGTLRADDPIRVTIRLKNTTTTPMKRSVYLDSNDSRILRLPDGGSYRMTRSGTGRVVLPIVPLTAGDYDLAFDLATIAPGETIEIEYGLLALPVAYGKIYVGLLEKWEKGDDVYGDIAMNPNNTCGGSVTIWRSVEPYPRSFARGTKIFRDTSELPESLKKNTIDKDGNGTPDYIDDLIASGKSGDVTALKKYSDEQLATYNADADGNGIPDRAEWGGSALLKYDASNGEIRVAGLGASNVSAINGRIDDVVRGLGCGFGWGACLSFPLNYAPLAPGSSPSIMGFPLIPSMMTPWSGLPIFAAPAFCGIFPGVWPPCPIGAGGWMGPPGVSQFRLFITPTITGAMGTAACFGPNTSGMIPPPGVSPLIPGGNCVVAAMPFFGCKWDGSDGDASSIGLGFGSNAFNANSCRVKSSTTSSLSAADRSNILSYIGGDNSRLPELNAMLSQGGGASLGSNPLIGIGLGSGEEPNFEVSIDAEALQDFDVGNIIKIKNRRISAFPDFIMEWVTRQMEEVMNKITTLPTLHIVMPDFSGMDLGRYTDFPDKFRESVENDTTDYADRLKSKGAIKSQTLSGTFREAQGGINATVDEHAAAINTIGRNVSGVKAAYEFMSHLPLIALEDQTVDIDIPWMSIEDANKWYADAERTVYQWEEEIDNKTDKWSKLTNKDGSGVDQQVILRAEESLESIRENMRIIDEYRKFPAKLQKYLTWKERYADQIICNVEAIEMIMGGWIAENGKRFRTWVELYVLIKAILNSWQLIIDLFNDYNEACAPCRNERWDLKHFIFKLISAVIPKIPIIQFPKWPDIWLDMHNIRAGLRILMPEFNFEFVPIVLPHLPELHLPDVPTLGIGLPSLPLLPRFPELPDLPDLPSLPLIELPNLPPPPTIPKLFGGIAAVLEILKLVSKILCILQINPFVPEWRAGDQIAQITERTGKLPIDFLMMDLPNFSLSFVDAIKVTSYVNLEFDSEFILEMVRATLEPLNTMTNNVSNIGSIQIPGANFQNVIPDSVDIDVKPKAIEDARKEGYAPTENVAFMRFALLIVDRFVRLNAFIADHAQDEVGLDTMKQILSDNARVLRKSDDPRVTRIADTIDRAARYDASDEEGFIRDLERQNTEKFGLVKEYLRGEQAETKRLQTELAEIMKRWADMTRTRTFAPSVSDTVKISAIRKTTGSSQEYTNRLKKINDRILPSMTSIVSGNEDAERVQIREQGANLLSQVRTDTASFAQTMKRNAQIYTDEYASSSSRLLAADASVASDTTSINQALSSAYSYNYQGIYIFDAKGNQVRLFDYIDAVDGTEEVIYLDTDSDGDQDILYRMDNNLYIKENHEKEPVSKKNTDTPRAMDYTEFLRIPTATALTRSAPNFFEETFTSSNAIDFSFAPANPTRDHLFRLEYYDYIDRFDRITAGESHQSAAPGTLLHKVDLIPDIQAETVSDATIAGLVSRKNIAVFQWGVGEGVITRKKYETMASGQNSRKIIAANRTIYTDAGGAAIEYLPSGTDKWLTLSLDKSTNTTFLAGAEILVTRGNIYLMSEASEIRTVELDTLRGMPIMPETRLEIENKNARSAIRYYDGSMTRLDGPVAYEYYPLGTKASDYHVTIAAKNSWYYAELYSFSEWVMGTVAQLKLLSPQRAADREGPLITYGDTIRIPVYQERRIDLGKYVEDVSGVTRISVDADLTKDTDWDGKADNDRDSLDPKTSYGITKGANIYDLKVGPFPSLFSKKIRLMAEDANGNTASKDIILFVYTPTPEITSVTGSIVAGSLDESLVGEPIDLFRHRNGAIVRIEPNISSASGALTVDGGRFSIPTKTGSWLLLARTSSGGMVKKEIAWIDERTGRVELRDTTYSLAVTPATETEPMRIRILWPDKSEIFSEYFALDAGTRIETVTSFDQAAPTGLSLTLSSDRYTFYRNIASAPFIPDGGYIVDADRKAVAGISRKGDIYVMNSAYRLDYTTLGNNVMIRLLDPSGNSLASVLYRVSVEYVVK